MNSKHPGIKAIYRYLNSTKNYYMIKAVYSPNCPRWRKEHSSISIIDLYEDNNDCKIFTSDEEFGIESRELDALFQLYSLPFDLDKENKDKKLKNRFSNIRI